MAEHMLTTIDNPWNPFTHFDEWYEFDVKDKHYNTMNILARNVISSDSFSSQFQLNEIEAGILEVIHNPLYAGIWIRVTKDSKIIPISVDELLESA